MCYVDHLWLLVMNENVDEIRAPHRYNPWCSGSDRVSSYTSPSLLNVFLISVIVCTFQQFAWSAAHFIRCFLTYNQARNIQCKQMKYFWEVLISPEPPMFKTTSIPCRGSFITGGAQVCRPICVISQKGGTEPNRTEFSS